MSEIVHNLVLGGAAFLGQIHLQTEHSLTFLFNKLKMQEHYNHKGYKNIQIEKMGSKKLLWFIKLPKRILEM